MDSDQLKERFLSRFMEITEDGFLLVDKNGKIVAISDAYYNSMKLSGHKTKEELIGMDVEAAFYNSRLPALLKETKPVQYNMEAFPTGKDLPLEEEKYSFCIRTCANILDDETGEVLGAFAHVRFTHQPFLFSEMISNMEKEVYFYKQQLQKYTDTVFSPSEILGYSPAIVQAKNSIAKAANTDFNVLIMGETGTGKELFASTLHNSSQRRDRPFIKLNCSAIPTELFEAELFGYEDGAFTGAKKGGKMGKFELANGGTIFLDEIADMPLNMQAKLLRVLQEQEIDRVGGVKTVKVDVRVVAATNKDLLQAIRDHTFRADLYYRLNVINIRIPPLRERREDIPEITEHFLRQLNKRYGTAKYFSPETISALKRKDWPGNVRELRNEVEQLFAFSEDRIQIEQLEKEQQAQETHMFTKTGSITLADRLREVERTTILEALLRNQFNFRKTAQELGISRGTLYNKSVSLGIDRPGHE